VTIVLDANILVRAVLGTVIGPMIKKYLSVLFAIPDVMAIEARHHTTRLLQQRAVTLQPSLTLLDHLLQIVTVVGYDDYGVNEAEARQRLDRRDPNDWPAGALALTLKCPIWTEDKDFFGCGIAIWTTDRVEMFFQKAPHAE
jgi:predicted nucleic acid-binding protein